MTRIHATQTIVWIAVVAALVALILYGFFWVLFLGERVRVAERTAALTAAEGAREVDAGLARVLADTASKRIALGAVFVAKSGVPAFLDDIERTGVRAGARVSIVRVSVQEGRELPPSLAAAGVIPLSVAAEARGSFAAVVAFAHLLETLPRPLSLSRASLAYDEEKKEWSGVFEFLVLQLQ
jgi:hypothetical protein